MSCGKSKKLILNIDPGIDDAQSVLMALARPDVQILALCLNHGNVSIEQSIINCRKLLEAIHRIDIPVYRGCGHALVTQPASSDDYFGKDGFGDYEGLPHPDEHMISQEHAVLAMIRLVQEQPGQITLVCLSPPTNLAMAHRMDPSFSKNLKDCFIMGGTYKAQGNITSTAEFNAYFDVEASDIVLSEFQCPISIFTWELCLESPLTWEFRDSLRDMNSIQARLVKNLESKLIDKWKENSSWVLGDELAMASALDERCMAEYKNVSVRVESHGLLTRGQNVIDWDNKSKKPRNVRLVTKMEMEWFKELLRQAYMTEL